MLEPFLDPHLVLMPGEVSVDVLQHVPAGIGIEAIPGYPCPLLEIANRRQLKLFQRSPVDMAQPDVIIIHTDLFGFGRDAKMGLLELGSVHFLVKPFMGKHRVGVVPPEEWVPGNIVLLAGEDGVGLAAAEDYTGLSLNVLVDFHFINFVTQLVAINL